MYIVAKIQIVDDNAFRLLSNVGVLHSTKASAQKEAKELALKHKQRYTVLEVKESFSTETIVSKEK